MGWLRASFKLASNANLYKFANFASRPDGLSSQKCLLVTFPQTPEIVTFGGGCAFKER